MHHQTPANTHTSIRDEAAMPLCDQRVCRLPYAKYPYPFADNRVNCLSVVIQNATLARDDRKRPP